jgi:hypothetical protein
MYAPNLSLILPLIAKTPSFLAAAFSLVYSTLDGALHLNGEANPFFPIAEGFLFSTTQAIVLIQ